MSTPYLIAIAAMSRNRVIGKDGKLPWDPIPEDMRWFRQTTLGHTVIMGRKTWASLGVPRLKGRLNVVLTSDTSPGGTFWARDEAEVLWHAELFKGSAFVIGGAQTYAALMPWTREILLTVIDIEVEGDKHFPEVSDEFELKSTTPLSERAVVHHYVRR